MKNRIGVSDRMMSFAVPSFTTGFFLLSIVFVVSKNAFAQIEWERLSPMPTIEELNGVHFVDENQGFMISDSSFFATSDGGVNWTKTEITGGGKNMEGFENTIVIKDPTESFIYVSVNAGDFWNVIDPFGREDDELKKVNISGDGKIAIVAQTSWTNTIYLTTDGGINWEEITSDDLPSNPKEIEFASETVRYLLSTSGDVYKTTDGGDSWSVVLEPQYSSSAITLIEAVSEDDIFAVNDNFINFSNDGGETWSETYYPLPYGVGTITSITFIDEEIGYLTSSVFGLLTTTDGGQTWNVSDVLYHHWFELKSIAIVGESGVVAVGGNGAIVRFSDYGQSWEDNIFTGIPFTLNEDIVFFLTSSSIFKMNLATQELTELNSFWTNSGNREFVFLTEEIGYALGDNDELWRTQTGGTSWEQLFLVEDEVPDMVRDFEFANENVGYVSLASSGRTYKTIDGGDSWEEVGLFSGEIEVVSEDVVIVRDFMAPFFRRTLNGGEDWEFYIDSSLPTGANAVSIHFFSSEVGYFLTENQGILKTEDGCETWEELNPTAPNASKMHFINESFGFIYSGNSLLQTMDGGQTWSEVDLGESILTYRDLSSADGIIHLTANPGRIYQGNFEILSTSQVREKKGFKIFPNPGKDEFRIEIPGADFPITLIITDIYGKLIHQEQVERSQEIYHNVSSLASGNYIITLRGPDFEASEIFHKQD
jgi:photosystem II stability/assembly factor-like uncharacterized protein